MHWNFGSDFFHEPKTKVDFFSKKTIYFMLCDFKQSNAKSVLTNDSHEIILSPSALSPLHHIYTVCVCLYRHQATCRALLPSSGSDFSDIPKETSAMCINISTLFFQSFKLQDVPYFFAYITVF
jgi:hypothetical protein